MLYWKRWQSLQLYSFPYILRNHAEELYHPEPERGHGGGCKGLVPFPYVTKRLAIKIERSKDFSRLLGENLLTLMTQILRETARKMVSPLSFKTFKMKFQKKAVRRNDCQVLLYRSQRADHTLLCSRWEVKIKVWKEAAQAQRGGEVGVRPEGGCFTTRRHHRDIPMVTWGL